jgi:5-methylthioadenosine/S-adenosylhomocysteine deaminase
MQEEAKFAAMIAKCNYGPETLPVDTVLKWSTINGAKFFGIDGGEIAVGKVADALLVNLNHERFVPNFNFNSNLIYASSCEAIDTMICNGEIIMRNRKVKGEEEIIAKAKECSKKWKSK